MAVSALPSDLLVVAADHPALDRDIAGFLDALRDERRFFGPSARTNPAPFPSLIERLARRDGFRLAAVECGRVVGLLRVDGAGEVTIAVAADRRGRGVGTVLGRAAIERARSMHYPRLVIRSTRRSRAARRVGEALGCRVVDGAHGRTDLVIDLAAAGAA